MRKKSESVGRASMSRSDFAVDCIYVHKLYGSVRCYMVRRYGNRPVVDTLQPAKNIPQHLAMQRHGQADQKQAEAQ